MIWAMNGMSGISISNRPTTPAAMPIHKKNTAGKTTISSVISTIAAINQCQNSICVIQTITLSSAASSALVGFAKSLLGNFDDTAQGTDDVTGFQRHQYQLLIGRSSNIF